MGTEVLERRFAAIGARVKVSRQSRGAPTSLGVDADRRGEFFQFGLANSSNVSIEVVDADRDERCLLLLVREDGEKSKFLCGFDERHWFVAAIPEAARGVQGVESAKDALQPEAVRRAVARMRPRDRFKRRNVAYARQGEWFFLPEWTLVVNRGLLRNEPLSRGGGNDHVLEFAHRRGGETVYVSNQRPRGISVDEFRRLSPSRQRGGGWRRMVRDPGLFARGRVWHPDHNTIVLHGWHRVLMNTEQQARARRNVAFLD